MTQSHAMSNRSGGPLRNIMDKTVNPIRPAVPFHTVGKSVNRVGPQVETIDASLRRTPRETKRRTTIATPDIEHPCTGFRRDSSGQKNRIDRNPVSFVRLGDLDPATEQIILRLAM